MSTLAGKHIVLGLSGGIAAFKSAELCRALVKAGVTVQVVMTEAAEHFMTAVTMQALSGRPVYTSQWDPREANNMAHINLSREADAIVVAPASADFIAKLAQGRADELLSLTCLARPRESCPLIVAPAMNREMWSHPATQRNLAQLVADGAVVFGPGNGDQACGEVGDGRMLEPEEILADLIARARATKGPAQPHERGHHAQHTHERRDHPQLLLRVVVGVDKQHHVAVLGALGFNRVHRLAEVMVGQRRNRYANRVGTRPRQRARQGVGDIPQRLDRPLSGPPGLSENVGGAVGGTGVRAGRCGLNIYTLQCIFYRIFTPERRHDPPSDPANLHHDRTARAAKGSGPRRRKAGGDP